MNKFTLTIFVSISVWLLISFVCSASQYRGVNFQDFAVFMGGVGTIQCGFQLLIAIVMFILRNKEIGLGLLLSGLIIFLIGFSFCSANFRI